MRALKIILLLLCLQIPSLGWAEQIPYLAFQDLKALYPKEQTVFDWAWPKVTLANQTELIKYCETDFSLFYHSNLVKEIPMAKDRLVLSRVMKNPNNSIIYFAFEIDPDRLNDVTIVYFINSKTSRLILKMRL